MVRYRPVLWTCLIVFTAAFLIPGVNADPVKKATEVTFAAPIEIPGMVLEPGVYVIKVPDPVTHDDMVGFYNRDESHLYKLVRTIPRYRLEVTGTTAITYEERSNGAPPAIKTWFYPFDNWGREFLYGKATPLKTAETVVPAEREAIAEAAPVAPVELAPEAVAEPAVEAAPAPVEVAEAAPAPEAFPGERPFIPFEGLPRTATPLPLIALIGFGALTLGGVLRLLPNRHS